MEDLLDRLPSSGATKGESGRIGIVAGSVEFPGPPALAGEAALRTGADVARVLTSEEILSAVGGYTPNLVLGRYTGEHLSSNSESKALALAEWGDVLVIGPGLGEPSRDVVRRILEGVDVPVVIDADAIRHALDASFSEAIVTPDDNEIDQIESAYDTLEAFSRETDAVVVATGAEDRILHGEERWTNDTGTAGLTVAGTGDTLAGIVGALVGRGLDRVEAARLGPWILGRAGELAAEEYGAGIVATDVVERIPAAIRSGRTDG
ncbi:MAG: NAD(P)H-hydrate dehydratase [Salinigranum sp.]